MKDKFSEQDGCRFSNILKLSPSLSYLHKGLSSPPQKKKNEFTIKFPCRLKHPP